MTADEIVFAGGKYSTDAPAYYYHNAVGGSVTGSTSWWTMSPRSCGGSSSAVFPVVSSGNLGNAYVGGELGVRPVLSLKSCVKWKSGNGTSDNPYTVDTLDSVCSSAEN